MFSEGSSIRSSDVPTEVQMKVGLPANSETEVG